MQIHDILRLEGEEEIRTLNIPNAIIIWSGPYSFPEVIKKSGGGLYVTVTKNNKPLYVGQTGSYKSRFRSRLNVLRIATCDLNYRSVYLGRIVKPAGKSVNKNLRLDLESVLIRSYLKRSRPIALINQSSIRQFRMGPESAVVTNKGTLPPLMKRRIVVKGNTLFELNVHYDNDGLYEHEFEDSDGLADLELFEHEDAEIRRRRPLRRKRPRRNFRTVRPRPVSVRPGPLRRKRRPRRRPYLFQRPRRPDRISEPFILPPVGTEHVRWVQSSLNQILGLRLRINGVMNRATREALRDFQKREGLTVDGIAGPETKQALIAARSAQNSVTPVGTRPEQEQFLGSLWGYRRRPRRRKKYRSSRPKVRSASKSSSRKTLNRNSREYIKWVQQSLNRVQGVRLSVDGILGPMTRSAIRNFQNQRGLAVDGIVGPATENALIAAGAARPGSSRTVSYIPTAPVLGRPPVRQPEQQRFITVSSTAITNPQIDRVVDELESFFASANLKVTLTSAIRTAEAQLGIIQRKAVYYKLDTKYPSIKTATVNNVESWLDVWDELLNRIGYVVNPPKPVTSRITGKHIGISPHMKGEAIDLSGANLDSIAAVVQRYCQQGGIISQILIERTNNAVHVGIRSRGNCRITQK